MRQVQRPPSSHEETEGRFTKSFAFGLQDDLEKTVTISRIDRRMSVEIDYIDGAVVDRTLENFDADGPVRITVTENGLYLASSCLLLAGRVRMQRTRYF